MVTKVAHLSFASLLLIAGASAALPAPRDDTVPEPKKEEKVLDRKVPIPNWSPRLSDNGCRAHKDPADLAADSGARIPFWTLVTDLVGRYSVRAIVDESGVGDDFRKATAALDPDTRTLATLVALADNLGRDDNLHTFYFLSGGAIAPDVRDALLAAGLDREHKIFAETMAVFGPTYPVVTKKREILFGYNTGPELNAFDQKLLAAGKEFPSAERLRASIVSFVAARPKLWSTVEAGRTTMGNQARLTVLLEAIAKKIPAVEGENAPEGLKGLSKEERTVFLLGIFMDEFENGGIHQFFMNSSGDLAPDIVDALNEAQLGRQAAIVERGMALFAAPYPRDRAKRFKAYIGKRDDEGFESELSALTDLLYGLDGGAEVAHIGGETQILGGPDLRQGFERYVIAKELLPC